MHTDKDFKAAASLGSLGNFHVVRMFAFHFECALMPTRTMSSTRMSGMNCFWWLSGLFGGRYKFATCVNNIPRPCGSRSGEDEKNTSGENSYVAQRIEGR